MGQKFSVGHLTAAMLHAIGQRFARATTASAGPTSGTTEGIYATSTIFTPDPDTWYLAMSTLNYLTGAAAASDGFWHRLRFNNVSGAEISLSRLDIVVSGGGAYSDGIVWSWACGSLPSGS